MPMFTFEQHLDCHFYDSFSFINVGLAHISCILYVLLYGNCIALCAVVGATVFAL